MNKSSFLPLVISLLTILVGIACSGPSREESAILREEMKDRKVKRLTPVRIVEEATRIGQALIDSTHNAFIYKQQSLPSKECNAVFESIAKEQGVLLKTKVNRYPFDSLKISQTSDPKQRELMLAYLYNFKNNLPMEPSLQKSGDSAFIAAAPILASTACLGCHQTKENSALGLYAVRISKAMVIRYAKN